MWILLPDQRGPHKIQAKYMGNSSCHSILITLFLAERVVEEPVALEPFTR